MSITASALGAAYIHMIDLGHRVSMHSCTQSICELSFPGSMDAESNPHETIVPIQLARETEALKEILQDKNDRLEARISTSRTRIARFPKSLRVIGGAEHRYVVPSVVAIGPYHHGRHHLQEMEEVKHAAAYRLLRAQSRTVEEVYEKVLSVAGDARRCYDDSVVAGLSDAEFARMMFVDGCFLLWYLHDRHEDPLISGCAFSHGPSILKDILRLENQIPLLVLEALMDRPVVDLSNWMLMDTFFNRAEKKVIISRIMRFLTKNLPARRVLVEQAKTNTVERSSIIRVDEDSKPPHLLGLLRSSMISGMPRQKTRIQVRELSWLLSRSAVDLAQIGVKLTASTANWFADMNVHKKPLCGELSLSSLSLDDFAACCLVNMAALEMAETLDASNDGDAFVVSSYLSLLAMLMDKEEDVHHLRMSGVLRSSFSNAQTLAFFKELGQHISHGYNYSYTLAEISKYMRHRPVRTAVHKFVYNHHRVIVAVLSIAGVLISILKALYSLKKP